eukprot:NODE_315_length_11202_cov_0.258849.p1 type:complete len:561 gc:universal NODE_315_length_11202_cov_0.258849:9047-10729(+)
MNCVKVFIKHRPERESNKFTIEDSRIVYQGREKDTNMSNGKDKDSLVPTEYLVDKVIRPQLNSYESMDIQHHALIFCEGRSSAVFTYGYSNSGKTHTWFDNEQGIIWSLINDIMTHKDSQYSLKMSICELYNDKLKNLCSSNDVPCSIFSGRIMQIVEDGKGKKSSINVPISDAEDFKIKVKSALKRRQVAATHLNDVSSRSHLIINIYMLKKDSNGNDVYVSRLALLDCAGNERLGSSQIAKKQTKEAGSINSNLFELKKCIRFLSRPHENNNKFAFRGSKLTLSLKGVEYMSIVACVDFQKENDSKNTLDFVVQGRSIYLDGNKCVRDSKLSNSSRDSKQSLPDEIIQSVNPNKLQTPALAYSGKPKNSDSITIQRAQEEVSRYISTYNGPADLDLVSAIKWIRKDRKSRDILINENEMDMNTVIENINEMMGSRTDCLDYLYNNVDKIFRDLQIATNESNADIMEMVGALIDKNKKMQQENHKLEQENKKLQLESVRNNIFFNNKENNKMTDTTNRFKLNPNTRKKRKPKEDFSLTLEIDENVRETRNRAKRVRLQK